jgi:hypothetical protein
MRHLHDQQLASRSYDAVVPGSQLGWYWERRRDVFANLLNIFSAVRGSLCLRCASGQHQYRDHSQHHSYRNHSE